MYLTNLLSPNTAQETSHVIHEQLLSNSITIARTITKQALWSGDRCNWVGQRYDHSVAGDPPLIFSSLNHSVYNGTAGIAHFLMTLHAYHPDTIFKRTALGAIRHAMAHVAMTNRSRHSFWSGDLGVALIALKIAKIFKQTELIKSAKLILSEILSENISPDVGLDILDGCAGAITAIIHYQDICTEHLEIDSKIYIRKLADHVISKSHSTSTGIYWSPTPQGTTPLLGYAHGNAGYAHALIEAGGYLSNTQYIQHGLQAIQYENNHFDTATKNWPDFRPQPPSPTTSPKFMNAWCHGAMGIGLSRLRCYQLLEKADLLEDVRASLSHFDLAPINNMSSCACHGTSGNIELLLYARETLQEASLNDIYDHHVEAILDSLQSGIVLAPYYVGRYYSLKTVILRL